MKKTIILVTIALLAAFTSCYKFKENNGKLNSYSVLTMPVIPDNLIRWGVNLDSNANDYKNICNGTVNGCVFTGSTGVQFNGTSDYIQFNSLPSFTLANFAFAWYINFKRTSNDTCYLMGNSDAVKTPSTQSIYAKISNGIVTMGFWQNKGLIKLELSTPTALNDGNNHSVVFQRVDVYNYKLFVDGNSTAVASISTYPTIWNVNKSNAHFSIGRLGDNTDKYYTGTINKTFLFWSINQNQVNYVGNSGSPISAPFY